MTRTRAEALALVNWKGVFYERYLLDRHVTALEGANGAGKTTVMIATYLTLLPDMSRLRFTNLGETGATGGDKGIWGRLGEPGRPSYAVIDFSLAGTRRLIAGVHLERKGDPTVESTPFIVWNLDASVRLQDLLLIAQGGAEAVPELTELRQNAARLGGRLQSYASTREYLATLFDQGIMPLRLGTDEERNKFNEMLRTSMTGGISRVLTSELRSFLLREESGLSDTLQRMRANLDACRRTRVEVQESRRLELEIGGVFAAGQIMFAAAFLATRERAEELSRRVADAEMAHERASLELETARNTLERTSASLLLLEIRKAGLDQELSAARDWQTRVQAALDILPALEQCTARHSAAETEKRDADRARYDAETNKLRCREERQRSRDGYTRASQGLTDLQQGIEELHRRAGAFRQAARHLREAETHLQADEIRPEQFANHLAVARNELERVDRDRREARRLVADAEEHRTRFATLVASLQRLREMTFDFNDAHGIAAESLRRYRQAEAVTAQLPRIERELADAQHLHTRQARAREQAMELGVLPADAPAAEVVGGQLLSAEAERSTHEAEERVAREAQNAAQRQHEENTTRHRQLLVQEPLWQEHASRALRLSQQLGIPVADRAGLDAARRHVTVQLAEACKTEELAREMREKLIQEARDLLTTGGPFSPALLQLRDKLGAELLASGFEETAIEEAALIEARLGPLSQALIVDDPMVAAAAVADRSEELTDVLLVPRDADLLRVEPPSSLAPSYAVDVLIHEGVALRVSRIPDKPRLGRRARERRAAELRACAEVKSHELDVARVKRRLLEELRNDGDMLLAELDLWLAGDPAEAIRLIQDAITDAAIQIDRQRSASNYHAHAAQTIQPRIAKLRVLLADAALLDLPNQAERVQTLEAEKVQARDAERWVVAHAEDALHLETGLAELRQLPLSNEEVLALNEHAALLESHRERLDAGIEALDYLRSNVEALGWEEAPRRLDAEQALIPALTGQLYEAQALQQAAEVSANDADELFEKASACFLQAESKCRSIKAEQELSIERLRVLAVPDPTTETLTAATANLARLERELQSHGSQHAALLTAKGRQEKELDDADQNFTTSDEKLSNERREAEPAHKRWVILLDSTREHGLVGDLLQRIPDELADIRGHINFVQAAKTQREVLLERLRRARDGETLLAEIQSLRDTSEAGFADAILGVWLTVRNWLRRRLPAQVAEVNDPREALVRLRDQLDDLDERLARQESELRGASEDVARGIDVQVRKARGQVTRLNKNLEAVSFGSIHGIQVRMLPVERMEQVLRALREGATQELLFQADMPIDEALEEIFRRYGGGRSGGQRLLDYREYVHLQVEIRRKSGLDWEIANPTRLSTGEAIGVGAALMMVVLTEWERDATLLRGKRAHGSLRFLFLDEANRLSPDNLSTLFDLCQTLELQLMIAAPEVARAEGNTTYRLVRRISAEGHEEVLVSGRRTRGVD